MDGVTKPDALGFAIDRFQRNAAVAQLAYGQQGCSGTVVGDRVVVSAAHCVVMNQGAWLGGAAPQVAPAANLAYGVGDDAKNPLCLLHAQSVQIHPQAAVNPANDAIAHDISVTILKDSVIDTCPDVVPVQINRDPVTQDMLGEWVLQGGFGSLDYTYNFSPTRYWSLQELVAIGADYVIFRSGQHGGPSFGDSGSGFLRHFPDGSVRTLGMDSLAQCLLGSFVRIDDQGSFLDQVVTHDLVCGSVGPLGICRDGAAVACGPNGFVSDDCTAKSEDCVVDGGGKAVCSCACDTSASCDAGCACDAACADGGADAGSDAGNDAAPPTGTCSSLADLSNAGSCGAGAACDIVDFVGGKAGCRPAGSVAAYATCSVSTPPCVAGTTCFAMNAQSWKCDPFCDPNAASPACPGSGACIPAYQLATSLVGVCMQSDDCDLASATGCPDGAACYLVNDARLCIYQGSLGAGAPCSYTNDCGPGFDCYQGTCTEWCNDKTACPDGTSCQGIGTTPAEPSVGRCLAGVADAGADDAADDAAPTDAAADAGPDASKPGAHADESSGCTSSGRGPASPLALLSLLACIGFARRRARERSERG